MITVVAPFEELPSVSPKIEVNVGSNDTGFAADFAAME